MNIIISAGGSGGHIYPALEIIEEFKKHETNLNILYIGTHNRMEKDIIPKLGIKYEELEIYGFTRDIKRDIKNVFLIKKALKKCKNIMRKFKPDVVIGVGGYVTYPVIKAANKLGIKTVLHEQNSRPGKVNYLISKFTDLSLISFKTSEKYMGKCKKIIYTGHPSLDKGRLAKKESRLDYGLSLTKKVVLFVAGSLGSSSLNNKMLDFLNSDLNNDYEILYIAGNTIDIEDLKKKVSKKNVKIVPYVNNLPGLMKVCDIVISRAGAGSLFEIIGTSSPSIIIPSPNVANNHQYYNALELSEAGAIIMLEENNLTKEILSDNINMLLKDENKINKLKNQMQKYGNIKPSKAIYDSIKKIIDSK